MPNEPVLVDTGALAALFDPNDPYHEVCSAAARELPVGKAFTCWPVITEAVYLLRRYPRQRDALLKSVEAGEFQVLAIESRELPELRDIFAQYHDQQVDLADATLLFLAHREGLKDIFTVDRRHFNVFRTQDGKPLRILP